MGEALTIALVVVKAAVEIYKILEKRK